MAKPNDLKTTALCLCLVLLNCTILDAGSIDKNNQKTAYDFYLSGNTFYRNGQYDRAISAYRESVELEPDYFYAHINLGAALAETKQFKEAVLEFTLCIDRKWGSEADRFVFYFNRALANREIGDTRAAQRDRASFTKLDPARAKELQNSRDYLLMDAAYVELRNEADKNRLFEQSEKSIARGKIIVRKVADSGKNAEEYEAIGLIEGKPQEVFGVLTDYQSYPEFMPNVKRTKIKRSTGQEAIVDYELSLPMGFVKKYRLKFWSKTDENKIQLFWKKVPWPGLKPKETVIDTYGQWILEDFPEKDNHVLAYYRVYTDPGNIPLGTGWIVDVLTKKSIPDIIKATRSRLKSISN